jgi:TPR repeat protein
MRYQLGILVVALFTPSLAAAQSTTADGIVALASGDTAAALRILQPFAESSEPDPLAQFFLATMYSYGAGVAADEFRACGLYLQSATDANPLANQVTALRDAILQTIPGFGHLCSGGAPRGLAATGETCSRSRSHARCRYASEHRGRHRGVCPQRLSAGS